MGNSVGKVCLVYRAWHPLDISACSFNCFEFSSTRQVHETNLPFDSLLIGLEAAEDLSEIGRTEDFRSWRLLEITLRRPRTQMTGWGKSEIDKFSVNLTGNWI